MSLDKNKIEIALKALHRRASFCTSQMEINELAIVIAREQLNLNPYHEDVFILAEKIFSMYNGEDGSSDVKVEQPSKPTVPVTHKRNPFGKHRI